MSLFPLSQGHTQRALAHQNRVYVIQRALHVAHQNTVYVTQRALAHQNRVYMYVTQRALHVAHQNTVYVIQRALAHQNRVYVEAAVDGREVNEVLCTDIWVGGLGLIQQGADVWSQLQVPLPGSLEQEPCHKMWVW